jgi:hypothetical protein
VPSFGRSNQISRPGVILTLEGRALIPETGYSAGLRARLPQLAIDGFGRFSFLSAFAVTNRQEFVHGICAFVLCVGEDIIRQPALTRRARDDV